MDDGGLGFDVRLGQAFGFDAADLEANRAGLLSDQQALILGNAARVQRREARRSRVLVGAGFALAIVVLGVGIAVTPGGGGGTAALVAALILLWIAAIVTWAMRRGRRHTDAVANARVQFVEGDLRVEPASFGDHYWAYVGRLRFGIDTLQWDALRDGARYRLHYFPLGRRRRTPVARAGGLTLARAVRQT